MLETMNGHSATHEHSMTNGHQSMSPPEGMNRCIENCQFCHRVCLSEMVNHCLEAGGSHLAPRHLKLMMDCAQICQTSADFMIRSSAFHASLCGICAQICDECAKSCMEVGDMDTCAEACRQCAESCRQMSGMASGEPERNVFVI